MSPCLSHIPLVSFGLQGEDHIPSQIPVRQQLFQMEFQLWVLIPLQMIAADLTPADSAPNDLREEIISLFTFVSIQENALLYVIVVARGLFR